MIRKSGSARRSLVRSPYRTKRSLIPSRTAAGAADLTRSRRLTPNLPWLTCLADKPGHVTGGLAYPRIGERCRGHDRQSGEGDGEPTWAPAEGRHPERGREAGRAGHHCCRLDDIAAKQRLAERPLGEYGGDEVLDDDADRPRERGAQRTMTGDQRQAPGDVAGQAGRGGEQVATAVPAHEQQCLDQADANVDQHRDGQDRQRGGTGPELRPEDVEERR